MKEAGGCDMGTKTEKEVGSKGKLTGTVCSSVDTASTTMGASKLGFYHTRNHRLCYLAVIFPLKQVGLTLEAC